MTTVTLKEARQRLGQLVDAAERGERILITRRGRCVARLEAAEDKALMPLPDLTEFRASLQGEGSLSDSLRELRTEERS